MKKKFLPAFHGLMDGLRDPAVRIQICMAAAAMIAAWLFRFTAVETCVVVMAIGLVITAEILNTCIERICDFVHPAHHEEIGRIKDLAAGAVLFASLCALASGMIIVFRHLFGGIHL